MVTPAHIVPEWYFLPYYAVLRSIPDKLLGVLAFGGSLAVWLLLPFLHTWKVVRFVQVTLCVAMPSFTSRLLVMQTVLLLPTFPPCPNRECVSPSTYLRSL